MNLDQTRTPLLSIVVPTFNQGGYIADCLQTLQEQSFGDFEVIIQDSESKDETPQVCGDFAARDARFRYFREKDTGQSDAINRGLARSTGRYWTWICSDDRYSNKEALQILVDRFKLHESRGAKIVGVYGDGQYMSETGEVLYPYHQFTRDLVRDDFRLDWPLSQPSSIYLRQRVQDVGGVNVSLNLGMDLDLFIKMLEGDRYFAYAPGMIADVRVQPNSKSVALREDTARNALDIVQLHFGRQSVRGSAYAREVGYAKMTRTIQRLLAHSGRARALSKSVNGAFERLGNKPGGRPFVLVWMRFRDRLLKPLMYNTLHWWTHRHVAFKKNAAKGDGKS